MFASNIGLRANATAMLVPSSMSLRVLRGEQQREERVVTGLRGPDAAVAGVLGFLRRLAGLAEIETDASVNLHGRGRTPTVAHSTPDAVVQ